MNSSFIICGLCFLCIAINGSGRGCGYCDTITFQPGQTFSWIIPPENRRPHHLDGTSVSIDQRNESPIAPVGGYGHPPFYLRHSHEQLSLPNEFLISPNHDNSGRHLSSMPIFRKLDAVDCYGDPNCLNVDITQRQQSPTTIHQSNIASVPATAPSDFQQQPSSSSPVSPGQSVSWPSSHGGGIGFLFFVPDSASHLPVEQLIHQQLALHRPPQFPFDISINCEDAAVGCSSFHSVSLPPPAATVNGRNVENGNYASLPSDEIDSSSNNGRRESQQRLKWRNISERLVQNRQQQLYYLQQRHHQQQQIQQLQQNQQDLSILP